MPNSIELERRFLLRSLPEGLEDCKSREMCDVYVPGTARHPTLRLRSNGETFEITKKEPSGDGDSSSQLEQTIALSKEEFDCLSAAEGKRLRRIRYYYPLNGRTAEISVFKDALEGLAMADFEFASREEMSAFEVPGFCLAEVTTDEAFAAGMLCGKSYGDIRAELERLSYERI